MVQKRPRVVVSVGASVDGKVALTRNVLLRRQPGSGLSGSMTPPAPASTAIDTLDLGQRPVRLKRSLKGDHRAAARRRAQLVRFQYRTSLVPGRGRKLRERDQHERCRQGPPQSRTTCPHTFAAIPQRLRRALRRCTESRTLVRKSPFRQPKSTTHAQGVEPSATTRRNAGRLVSKLGEGAEDSTLPAIGAARLADLHRSSDNPHRIVGGRWYF